jgi:glycosyltransferase involved in cell wall biosynthesis
MVFSNGEGIGQNIFYQLYLLSIIIAYYLWFWIKHNQTLGMKSWKSYIVNKDNGKELLISQCLIRIFIALIGGHLFLLFYKESLQEKVKLLGFKDNIFTYLKNCHCFISTSLWEDPGFVLIESGFCKLPVITSDCPNGPKEDRKSVV